MIRILFVEDHLLLRESTRPMLEAAGDLVVVGEAASAQEAVRSAERLRPEVVLLDLGLAGGSSGMDAARQILRNVPEAAIVILTGVADAALARAALRLGIRGYMLKTVRVAELVEAIRQVHAGEMVIDPTITDKLTAREARRHAPDGLTERERAILHFLAAGKTYTEIASTLVISVRTIDWHVRKLREKLNLPSHSALVAHASFLAADAALATDRPDALELFRDPRRR